MLFFTQSSAYLLQSRGSTLTKCATAAYRGGEQVHTHSDTIPRCSLHHTNHTTPNMHAQMSLGMIAIHGGADEPVIPGLYIVELVVHVCTYSTFQKLIWVSQEALERRRE